jgi:hypothetical protein
MAEGTGFVPTGPDRAPRVSPGRGRGRRAGVLAVGEAYVRGGGPGRRPGGRVQAGEPCRFVADAPVRAISCAVGLVGAGRADFAWRPGERVHAGEPCRFIAEAPVRAIFCAVGLVGARRADFAGNDGRLPDVLRLWGRG